MALDIQGRSPKATRPSPTHQVTRERHKGHEKSYQAPGQMASVPGSLLIEAMNAERDLHRGWVAKGASKLSLDMVWR